MRSFARHPVQLLLVTLIALELALRFVLPLPAITNFNRVDFARLWLFGGLDEVARTGGRPTEQSSYRAPQPLRNVKLSWISDPDDVDEVVTLNLYGFRGPDFEIEKAPGTQRVIFLGDSFAEGFGVADDATIPLAFERAVQEDGLEVLNLGVGGVGLPMIAALADVAIPLLSPDYVVVVVYHNDLPALPLDRDRLQAGFEPIRAQWWMPRLIESAIHLWRDQPPALFYHRGPFAFFRPVPHPSNPRVGANDDALFPPEVATAMRAGRFNPFLPGVAAVLEERLQSPLNARESGKPHLRHIRRLCREHGCAVLAAFIPLNVTVSDHYHPFWNALGANFEAPSLTTPAFAQQQLALGRTAAELEIPFVDTTEAIRREESRGRRLYANYDEHMNAAGYELVGKLLARRFQTEWPD